MCESRNQVHYCIIVKRRKYEVFYHKSKSECDFILRTANQTVGGIQVCKTLYETSTKEREVKGLLEAMQQHQLTEGLILTFEEKEEINREDYAINVMPVWEWLLNIET